ncbi:MAG: retroviral-like aspartic protease family protein [Synechococcales bacterium]|nr:retroviral-like aspartic protease family protein [Synechococcales bacterium]
MTPQVAIPVRLSLLLGALSLCLTACLAKESPKTGEPSASQSPVAQAADSAPQPQPSQKAQGSSNTGTKAKLPSKAATQSTSAPSSAKPPAQPKSDPKQLFETAIDKAEGARSISQSAQAADELQMAVDRWKEAIRLMKQVIQVNPKYPKAQQQLATFQTGLGQTHSRLARAQGRDPSKGSLAADPCLDPEFCGSNLTAGKSNGKTYRARIKYYHGGIPVVDVRFNGNQTFEMMVDTGASGTMITETMAASLQVKRTGSVTVGTASGIVELSTGTVRSLSLGGGTMFDLSVTIGPVPLLGHDFFGDCDVTIRRNQNIVEFAQCST